MLKPAIAAALAVCGLSFGAPDATANETDWLYFRMYARDTAHAIDLKALHFREDGLLVSGTRYPRMRDEAWPPSESERGWYEYHATLIDCETGSMVATEIRLLDENSQIIATRPYEKAQWVERLVLGEREKWPDNSEIMLACSAASNPGLKARRAKLAHKPQPLIGFVPVTSELKKDTDVLMAASQQPYDLGAIQKRMPTTATELFTRLQKQYTAWRRSIVGPSYTGVDGLLAGPIAETQRKMDAKLKQLRTDPSVMLHLLPNATIEFNRSPLIDVMPLTQVQKAKAERAEFITETVRADCNSGLVVPIEQSWCDEKGRPLLTTTLSAKAVMESVSDAIPSGAKGPIWDLRKALFVENSEVASNCRFVLKLASGPLRDGEGTAQEEQEDEILKSVSPTEAQFNEESTPEAMLLKIRAAWRKVRP